MVTFDRQVWQVASMLVLVYGCDAAFEAGSRADELVERGDPDGAVRWLRIVEAVEELQRTEPAGELLH